MKDLPTVRWLLRILINPGWAPLLVVLLHLALANFGLTHKFDHLLHFLGGVSISWFIYRLIPLLPINQFNLPQWTRYLLTFTSACTIALFWEFAEFSSDRFYGTSIQQSLAETMLDLFFGVLGATLTTFLSFLFSHLLRRKKVDEC